MQLGAERIPGLDTAMSEHPENSAPAEPASEEAVSAPVAASRRSAEQTERAKRLAGALRDNLRRRKAPKRPPANSGN